MKKVAILTLNGYFNYGNRLQNYALQEVIKNLGFEVETVINETKFNNKTGSNTKKLNKVKKLKEKNIKELYEILYTKLENYLYKDKLNQQRTQIFKNFSLSYIAETDYSISKDNIPDDLSDRYDFFVTGSDQVWNPNYKTRSSIDFLTFAPVEKRIAYAPSFGVSEISQEYVENYRLWLSEMAHLSVREEAGAEIIKELTDRDAPVVLDPTMMLTKEKWLSISKVPSDKPMKKYLLTYFLGDIPKERVKTLKDIAKKNDLEIIHLAQIKDKVPYLSGPSEFIDYINSASVFCTDSFHGAVFSILLDTPFIVFNREGNSPSMNSRIETLLKTFKLESRTAENIQTNNQIFNVDYSHTVSILEEEKKKAMDYLKKALDIKK
ncbi:polysaccharide pyruvyl transferase family protein [Oceanobacillus profundus]|uniref:polysaccharide pyruvyl transferase family protein n=1 Tax=Oceanobacillus profundus TaxID=372463 RepID=UPI0020401BCF|nr:polysaccharide pyruvyl transferase family protein [Oceanobacillus profundus]MCM3399454.1 polysaccharide pyruvyl transferase family protein [Oceanobacillus profundus]